MNTYLYRERKIKSLFSKKRNPIRSLAGKKVVCCSKIIKAICETGQNPALHRKWRHDGPYHPDSRAHDLNSHSWTWASMIFGDEACARAAKPEVARVPEGQIRLLGPALARATHPRILEQKRDCSRSRKIATIKYLLFVLARPAKSARSSNISWSILLIIKQ